MKRKLISLFSVCLAVIMSFAVLLTGCSLFGGNDGKDNDKADDTQKEYTIQYTADGGTVKLNVKKGDTYALEVIPEKTGYDFLGLFDKETGGTQFVLANGSCAAPFSGDGNLVLYPRYKAKEYTLILDYQGAPVTGSRQLTATYGTSLPELPKDLTLEHKQFTGWYTQAEGKGVQVADRYGLVPIVSVVNETNFNLSAQNLTLYAGFETQKVTVTCHFDDNTTEQVEAEYGTPVSNVLPKKRNADGEGVLTWSKTNGGNVYNGKITEACDLYAVEYAPVIELDLNGGSGVNAVVARAGAAVEIPVPEKNLAKFSHWEDMHGNEYTAAVMPSASVSLKAVWQAKLVFDENGGSEVDDISVKAGENVTLPVPEKEGFIFAGWFKADKEKYTATIMPSAGVQLKAGWYKEKMTKVELGGSPSKPAYTSFYDGGAKIPLTKSGGLIDLSDFLPSEGGYIKIKYTYAARLQNAVGGKGSKVTFGKYFYDGTTVSENYLVDKYTAEVTSTEFKEFTFDVSLNLTCNEIYVANYISFHSGYGNRVYYYNIVREMTYGDTSYLYL